MNLGIERIRHNPLASAPSFIKERVDSVVGELSRVKNNIFERPLRSVLYTTLVTVAGFTPDSTALPLNTVLNTPQNPEKAAAEGEFTTRNLLINTADAAGSNRVLLPLAARDGTPIPTPTPTRIPTPGPTATPDIRNCSPWPAGDSDVLVSLPLVDRLCLTIFEDPSQAPDWIRQYGAGYDPSIRSILYLRSRIPNDPQFTMAHELCHAHQHDSVLKAGFGEPPGNLQTWLNTPEGQAFITASNMTIRNNSFPWSNFGDNLVEDFAEICRHTYKPAKEGAGWLNGWPVLVDFVREWLPTGTYR